MTKVIKAIIIDDERYSRDELKHLLTHYEIIDVIDEAETGEKGLLKVIQAQPDVVFLDIEMPRMSGMDVAKALKELKKVPQIVFATAYPDFAADAFRLEAVDYLLKPFEEEQVEETVRRIEKRLRTPEIAPTTTVGKLAVEGNEQIIYIEPKNILYIYREDNVTKIVDRTKEYETKTTLKEFESRLKGLSFFRIHKSYIVNLDYVSRLVPWFNGAFQIELQGGKELLSVSRNYVKALREKLEL